MATPPITDLVMCCEDKVVVHKPVPMHDLYELGLKLFGDKDFHVGFWDFAAKKNKSVNLGDQQLQERLRAYNEGDTSKASDEFKGYLKEMKNFFPYRVFLYYDGFVRRDRTFETDSRRTPLSSFSEIETDHSKNKKRENKGAAL